MKRIIVPTGYMGSGSSAITDLISEFKDCQNKYKSFEYVFLHSPNGLFDLEDKILIGNNAIRSDEALRTFRTQMKKLYDKKYWWVGNYKKIIGEDFIKITDEFIDSITELNYDGFWYTHEEVNLKMFIKLLLLKPFKVLSRNKIKSPRILKYKDGMKISFIDKKDFYQKSKDYIYKVIDLISKNESNVILDQLLLPFNLHRIDKYFDDKLKVIVVERDPRDVFIINKYIWPERNATIPVPVEVNQFCDYYEKMRKSEINTNSSKILRVKFEDLIYNYDIELKSIKKFLNFSDNDHLFPKSRFNPDISIKNTQLFNSKKYDKEIKVIEAKLTKYLYRFPYQLDNKITETVEFE